jgi:hypothetical protein
MMASIRSILAISNDYKKTFQDLNEELICIEHNMILDPSGEQRGNKKDKMKEMKTYYQNNYNNLFFVCSQLLNNLTVWIYHVSYYYDKKYMFLVLYSFEFRFIFKRQFIWNLYSYV